MTLLVQPLHLALPTKTTSSIALNNNHTAASPKSTPTHQKLQSNNPATTSSYYYSSANAQKNTDMNNTNNNNTSNDNMNHNNINNSEQPTTIIETKTQPITTSQTTVGAEKKAHFLRKRLPEESHKITLVIDMDETLISAHLHPYKRRRNTLQKSTTTTTTESSVNNHMNNKKSTNNGTTPSQEKREFALPSHVYHSSAAASRTTTRRLSFSNLIRGNHPNSNPQNNTPTPNSPARSKIPPSKNGNSPASSTATATAALPVLPLPLITSRQVMDPPLPPPSPTSTTPNNDDSHILMMRAIPSAPIACEGNHSLLSREQLIEGRSLSPSSSSLLSTVVTHSVDTDDEDDDDEEEEEDEDPLIHGLEYFETEFVSEQGTHERVTVYKRPFLYHFLSQVKQWFEVVLFTSSTQPYADSILDQIEREAELYGATQGASGANGSNAQRNRETINLGKNKVFSERLYRRHCTRVEPMFCLEMFQSTCVVKDLNRLGRDLNKTVIIDNSPSAYKWHTRNAMPVSTWSHTDLDSTTDEELNQLLPYLYQMFISNEIDQSLGQYKSQFRRNDFYEDECGDNQGSCRIS